MPIPVIFFLFLFQVSFGYRIEFCTSKIPKCFP
nr:MAG TPA: PsbA, PsbB, PsbC, PsbD, PsbE-FCP supercomplex, PLANT PROTEIN [Caudoviricetes sp.]